MIASTLNTRTRVLVLTRFHPAGAGRLVAERPVWVSRLRLSTSCLRWAGIRLWRSTTLVGGRPSAMTAPPLSTWPHLLGARSTIGTTNRDSHSARRLY